MNSRRDFLQRVAAPLIAWPFLTGRAQAAERASGDVSYEGPVLRVAIMGLGGYGTMVAEAMKDCRKAKLVGLISGTPSKITD